MVGSLALTRTTSYSTLLATAAAGKAQRGMIHSAFDAAANIVFPGDLVLSLNAANSPRMPNGLELSSISGTFPFTALRPGMPVIFGAQRILIEAANCSLDLSHCTLWDPHISRPAQLDRDSVVKNGNWLAGYLAASSLSSRHSQGESSDSASFFADALKGCRPPSFAALESDYKIDVLPMASRLCGRGPGLTPTGDDILAGWMAINWLLYGPQPRLLEAFQHIMTVARRQTHLLSRCWLDYAAEGNVAQPLKALLETISSANETMLITATRAVSAMGATSGYDLLQGILLGLQAFGAG
ncbi:MAG: DUF2877 domain-containing protein [Chloroflexota bacterium]|nr:DUF2877 domain-containing protein [Chloroflexota bacterium]